jgi:GNAT superfamily N-acetyltransferase
MEEPVLSPARADFAIRPARRADAAELLRLIRELAAYEKLEDMAVGTVPMLEEALFGARPAAEAMVAERGGRAVGFALYFTTFSTFLCRPGLYLEDLFVEPAHRGAGIGKALLASLATLAAERGCGRLEWRVLDWNEPSIRFYESLGASLLREWILVRMTREEFQALAKSGTDPVFPKSERRSS